MDFSDRLQTTSDSKLLPFRAPSPALRSLDGLHGLGQMPHDNASLRRPAASTDAAVSRVGEQEGLAHDARNLMTSLELFSTLLATPGVLTSECQHYATDLKSLTGMLSSLVERMAKLPAAREGAVFTREPLRPQLGARAAEGPRDGQPQLASPAGSHQDAGLMIESCERLLSAIVGPNVTISISSEAGLGQLALSGEELTRVLINLVKNASEAMPAGGRIAITVRKGLGAEPSAIIHVQDNGGGIPAHALGLIFQAGFTSKRSRRKWPETDHHGLGLTIVRDLVESAGGSVRVASALKKGTNFEIKLPCRRA